MTLGGIAWYEVWDRLVSVLYPQRCVVCGDVVEYDDMWCGRCVLPVGGRVDLDPQPSRRYADAAAAFLYEGEIRRMLLRLKEKEEKRCLRFLGEEMAARAAELWPEIPFDLMVPVPTTKAKLEERGFNQAELLAAALHRVNEVPVAAHALIRNDSSETQHSLSARQRRVNAAESYELGDTAPLSGKIVLLIDDVITTGSTAAACAVLLLSAGASQVYALAAAKTPLRGDAVEDDQ